MTDSLIFDSIGLVSLSVGKVFAKIAKTRNCTIPLCCASIPFLNRVTIDLASSVLRVTHLFEFYSTCHRVKK